MVDAIRTATISHELEAGKFAAESLLGFVLMEWLGGFPVARVGDEITGNFMTVGIETITLSSNGQTVKVLISDFVADQESADKHCAE